ISQNMEQQNGLIFGEDIVLDGDIIYCLTSPILENGNWLPSKLYEYNHKTKTTKNINLGEIVLARSLTYNKQFGLYINVMPTYHYEWFIEYDSGMFVNDNGGIYFYNGESVFCVAPYVNGIFSSKFSPDGKLYAVDQYGKILVLENNELKVYIDDLFTMLKHISFSPDGKIMYITAFGGGVYKVNLEKLNQQKNK
ncbi:MAG: PD40 domain-containing protein, partial [Clostridia bacterium]|nr:PD40 domain-containing protein [Clostridia bacterium]